jgi:hypothetical protein
MISLRAIALVLAGFLGLQASPVVAEDFVMPPTEKCNPATMTLAANQLIQMGPAAAYHYLRNHADAYNEFSCAIACRLLYRPKAGMILREPLFGMLPLPHLTMPKELWPDLPIVFEQGVPFLLPVRPLVVTMGEDPTTYVDYCHENGLFRATPYSIPTKEKASAALASLLASPRWKALKWQDQSGNEFYTFSAGRSLKQLRSEVEAMQ